MKGLVLQIKGKYAYIVDENGVFARIINKEYKAGQEINISPQPCMHEKKAFSIKTIASLAAVLVLSFTLAATGYCFFTPFSYVTIDINPSLEFSVNYFDMVIGINAINDDAKHLVENKEFSLKYKNVSSAAEKIIDEAVAQGYVKVQHENPVVVAVVSDSSNRADIIVNQISIKIKDKFDKNNIKGDIVPVKADKKQREEAQTMHISAGKLALIKKLENKSLQKMQQTKDNGNETNENKKDIMQSELEMKIDNNIEHPENSIVNRIKNKIENKIKSNNADKITKNGGNKKDSLNNVKENHTDKETQRQSNEAKDTGDIAQTLKQKTNDLTNMPVKELVKKLKNKQTDQFQKNKDEKVKLKDKTQKEEIKENQDESKGKAKDEQGNNGRRINENKEKKEKAEQTIEQNPDEDNKIKKNLKVPQN